MKSINVAITLISCRSRPEQIRIVWLTPRSFIRIFSDQELQTNSYNFDMQYPPPSMWLSQKHLLFMLMFGLLSNNHMQLFDKNKNKTLQFPYKHVFQKLKSLSFSSKQVKVKNITFYQYFFLNFKWNYGISICIQNIIFKQTLPKESNIEPPVLY